MVAEGDMEAAHSPGIGSGLESSAAAGDDGAGVADDQMIASRLGYKQELYRGVGGLGNCAIGFSGSSTWLSVLVIFTFALSTGGPGPLVWGFFISFVLNMCVVCVMGEICSAFPQVSDRTSLCVVITAIVSMTGRQCL
jgi:hypothetical protein